MIYIFVALFAEAKPLIQCLSLKRQKSSLPFERYVDEEKRFCLVLTGVGSVAAATAVGSVCTDGQVGSGDILCNVGTCAGRDPGQAFLVHKITEASSGRTFYPDLLYRCPFAECSAVTVAKPLQDSSCISTEETLSQEEVFLPWREEGIAVQPESVVYDMESSGFYQAASCFAGPHQIICIKVVSDTGREESVPSDQLTKRISAVSEQIAEWFETLENFVSSAAQADVPFSRQEEETLQRICVDMHCSETMRSAVRRQFLFAKLAGRDPVSSAAELYEEGVLPCRDRREGKRCWNDIRKRFV